MKLVVRRLGGEVMNTEYLDGGKETRLTRYTQVAQKNRTSEVMKTAYNLTHSQEGVNLGCLENIALFAYISGIKTEGRS